MPAGLLVTSSILAASPAAAAPSPDDAACGMLKTRTQVFSDAGQRNDGAVMATMLDANVIFFNEGGDRATRADMAANTPASASEPKVTMAVTDWSCHRFGDTAVRVSSTYALQTDRTAQRLLAFARLRLGVSRQAAG